ncbi:unnamed protein product [Rotaria sp. Silwood1]|nr:unnamed protein product [Rotaria sp. Silwood1]CAF4968180.1 unnamed protein product [Rotaria sp. Silwood1]
MSTEDMINLFAHLLNYILAVPMIILGVTGSILIVIIFTQKRQFRQNTSLTYLLAGAIMSGLHLAIVYTQWVLVYGFGVPIMNTNETACREYLYLRYVTTVGAISFPCWAAFDQYVATSRDSAVRHRWSSLRLVRLVIISTVIFWILTYIPIIFSAGILNNICILKPSLYAKFKIYILTPFVYEVGPAVIIIFSTIGTVRNLRSNTVHRSRKRLTNQVRAMLMPQLIILAISGIPFSFQAIYVDITNGSEKTTLRIALENFFDQIILVIYHFNYVFIFYIYLYKSSEVRKALKEQFFKCIRKHQITFVNTTTNNSFRLQRINTTHWTQLA